MSQIHSHGEKPGPLILSDAIYRVSSSPVSTQPLQSMQPIANSETAVAVPWSNDATAKPTTTKNVRIVKLMFSDIVNTGNDNSGVEDTFANAIWPILAIAQIFGQMPVNGIRPTPKSTLVFRWRTLRVLWTGFYLACSAAFAILYLRQISRSGINAKNVVGFVFFSFCFSCGLLFLFLAQRWTKLIAVWSHHEHIFVTSTSYQMKGGWRLSTKIRMAGTLVLSLALLEHGMFYMSNLYTYFRSIHHEKWSTYEQWQYWVVGNYSHIFSVLPYNLWLAVCLLFVNFTFTFAWNYMDIFIMLISIGLSTRFQQINQRLAQLSYAAGSSDQAPASSLPPAIWLEIRQHYVLLCELLETVDANLAPIIVLSCANNLYFICFQLLNIFNTLPYLVNDIYFWYSLLYLIGRTICVFLCAASIHDASRRPLEYIRHASTAGWCTELERFADQISNEMIALSGMRFFYMTRKLLFGMAGTIVTYELVLLQIDANSAKKSPQ